MTRIFTALGILGLTAYVYVPPALRYIIEDLNCHPVLMLIILYVAGGLLVSVAFLMIQISDGNVDIYDGSASARASAALVMVVITAVAVPLFCMTVHFDSAIPWDVLVLVAYCLAMYDPICALFTQKQPAKLKGETDYV